MAFTDNADLYGAIHEDGLNHLVFNIMQQRPALFNYGTDVFVRDPHRMCAEFGAAQEVYQRGNPLVTREDPLPIPGTGGTYGFDFCVQIVEVTLDCHPGNAVTLPIELGATLLPQRLAIRTEVHAGLGCPPPGAVEGLPTPPWPHPSPDPESEPQPRTPPAPIPWEEPICFRIELAAVAHVESDDSPSDRRLQIRVDGLEIVDIEPDGLENLLECYITVLLELVVLPRVNFALAKLVLELMSALPGIVLSLPVTAAIPNNPAIEDDQLKVFVNAEVVP